MPKSSKKAKLSTESLRPVVESLSHLCGVRSSYNRRRILYMAGFHGDQVNQLSTVDIRDIWNTINNLGYLRGLPAPLREIVLRQVGLSQRLTNRLIQIVNYDCYHSGNQPHLQHNDNNNNDQHNL